MKPHFLLCLLLSGHVLPGVTATLRTAADLSAFLHLPSATNAAFDITATVTYVSTNAFNEETNLAAADTSGATLFRAETRAVLPSAPSPGVVARFTGKTVENFYGRRFAVLSGFRTLSTNAAPIPVARTIADLLNATNDFRLSRLSATLTDVAYSSANRRWILLSLRDKADRLFCIVPFFGADDFSRLTGLVGARIETTGVCVPYDHGARMTIGRIFKVAAAADIRTSGAAPPDDNALPFVTDLTIAQPDSLAVRGRHRVRGHVVAAWMDDHAVLKDKNGSFHGVEFSESGNLPRYGDFIEATGLPETDLFRINLYNATWKPLSRRPIREERPTDVQVSELTLTDDGNGQAFLCCQYHGRLISFSGIVRSIPNDGPDRRIYVESDSCLTAVDVSLIPQASDALSVGCTVRVTGTCVMNVRSCRVQSAICRIDGFTLVPRSADDIRVLARPPWWTPGRLMILFGLSAIALIGAITWNISLNRRAKAKGRELAAEQLAHISAELKVNERTRLAVELHDALSQSLTGVSMQLDTAAGFATGKTPAITKCLNLASRTIDACRMELRNTLWDLRSAALDEPSMDAAIRKTLCQNLAGIDLSVRFDVPREAFSDNTAHAILKIIRELATNAIRHGRATALRIAGAIEDGKLLFSVRDNGRGFDPDLAPGIAQGHFGLQGITERLERLNGEMKIESSPGKGAKVTIILPIPVREEEGVTAARIAVL